MELHMWHVTITGADGISTTTASATTRPAAREWAMRYTMPGERFTITAPVSLVKGVSLVKVAA